ncbi:uncharacterized protein LOC107865556 [Capsicum annuum]|uniref:uncharacterized protein LOC107865556 n=1 Tax=Capsicum annuum TaxID=4072 RepID=UPI0007BFCB65|nr:uncharacterized protein LOC107865556 [Capsicum annuum]
MYPNIEADALTPGISDHTSLLVQGGKQINLYPKPFKLYTAVMEHTEFAEVVQRTWYQQVEMLTMKAIWQKLKLVKAELKELNTYMASYSHKLNQTRQQLEQVQAKIIHNPLCQTLFDQEKSLITEINKWSDVEEKMLRQKSRACWIKSGDANTKYFYEKLRIGASKNTITSIYTTTETKLTDLGAFEEEFMTCFKQLMGSNAATLPCPNTEVIRNGVCLTRKQQLFLIMEITIDEIDNTIKGMAMDKAPGVDGFPVEFFTKNWATVKNDVCDAIQKFFSTGTMDQAWNCTTITLVQKHESPTQVKDY